MMKRKFFFSFPGLLSLWLLSHLESCSRPPVCLELPSTYSLRLQPVTNPSCCFLNTPGKSSPLAFSTEFSLCVALSVTRLGSFAHFYASYKLLFSCPLYARLTLPTLLQCPAPTPKIPPLPSMFCFSPLLSFPPNIHMIFFCYFGQCLTLLLCQNVGSMKTRVGS